MTPRQIEYQAYLKSESWAELKSRAYARYGRCCNRCGTRKYLQVHHRIYRGDFYAGIVEDLEILCVRCHERHHGVTSSANPQHQPKSGTPMQMRIRLERRQKKARSFFAKMKKRRLKDRKIKWKSMM